MESEASLLRRLSGRRKPTHEQHTERRAYSFDVSRDGVASDTDHKARQPETPIGHDAPQIDQRSFTDSTVSTTALVQELESVTPPFGTPITGRVQFTHRYSSAPESPPPKHPATFDLTPRPFDKTVQSFTEHIQRQLTIPYVRLDVTMDTSILDYGEKRNIWIAIEATVDQHIVDLPTQG